MHVCMYVRVNACTCYVCMYARVHVHAYTDCCWVCSVVTCCSATDLGGLLTGRAI